MTELRENRQPARLLARLSSPDSLGRAFASDSAAVLLTNGAFMAAGLVRTKLTAVALGPASLGVISQLTQLSTLAVFVSAAGLGPGVRLAFARSSIDIHRRHGSGKVLVRGVLIAGSTVSVLAFLLAKHLSVVLLGSSAYVTEMRIMVVAVPLSAISQLFLPMAQAAGEFRRVAVAALIAAALGIAATMPIYFGASLTYAAATIPIAATLQALLFIATSPTIRAVVSSRPSRDRAVLKEIRNVGLLSFAVGVAAIAAETSYRAFTVHLGGLDLVAHYQPIYLLAASGFGLLLGALGSTLIVHMTRSLESGKADITAMMNTILMRTLVLIGAVGFVAQAASRLYIDLLFSDALRDSVGALSLQVAVETIRSAVWVLGALLLPLHLKRYWAISGLSTVISQLVLTVLLLPLIDLYAFPVASGVAWMIGFLVVRRGLKAGLVLITRRSVFMIAATFGAQAISAAGVIRDLSPAPFGIYIIPVAAGSLWALTVALGTRVLRHRTIAL